MSEFYKAKIDDLTKEQLAEIINHQTSLHVESKALLVLAKEELQSRDAEIVRLEKELSLYDSDVRHFNAQIEKRDNLLAEAYPHIHWLVECGLEEDLIDEEEKVYLDEWLSSYEQLKK